MAGYRSALAEGVEPGTRDLVLELGEPLYSELVVRDERGEAVEEFSATAFDPGRKRVLGRVREVERPGQSWRLAIPAEEFVLVIVAEQW